MEMAGRDGQSGRPAGTDGGGRRRSGRPASLRRPARRSSGSAGGAARAGRSALSCVLSPRLPGSPAGATPLAQAPAGRAFARCVFVMPRSIADADAARQAARRWRELGAGCRAIRPAARRRPDAPRDAWRDAPHGGPLTEPIRMARERPSRPRRANRVRLERHAMPCHAMPRRTHANRAAASCAAREPLASITPPPALEP
ncbi:hypothetical protein AQ837_06485 [Burkholderia pseudomallei]|nr:hypothetical protein AQ819_13035 [Burkholderia pseudomallei]OMY09897.1 hypothetical protein AQ837_06485 [Burkholderia pseudomallei]OMY13062.1 hypothetical protein AQ838_06990 [Burkholderia pseudomallei]OMY26808.1 hypothetical protein AQ839_04590 [Burkholderia pseudomallei]OMY37792.1 hypothetical protein AQ840_19530 [Burkholderia pseudomallei]